MALGLLLLLRAPACLAFEDPSPQKLFSQKIVAEVAPSPARPRSPASPVSTTFEASPASMAKAVYAAQAVVSGDTLYSLSRRYGVSEDALMKANGLSSPKELRAGMRLRLPYGARPALARTPGPAAISKSAKPAKVAKSSKAAKRSAVAPDPCLVLNAPDIRPDNALAGISDPAPGPKPPLSIPTTYKVNPALTLAPEYKNAGAALFSCTGDEFGGYGAGLKANFTTKSGARFIGMFGYSMDFSTSSNPDKPLGVDADASIGGLGAGVGMRRSF